MKYIVVLFFLLSLICCHKKISPTIEPIQKPIIIDPIIPTAVIHRSPGWYFHTISVHNWRVVNDPDVEILLKDYGYVRTIQLVKEEFKRSLHSYALYTGLRMKREGYNIKYSHETSFDPEGLKKTFEIEAVIGNITIWHYLFRAGDNGYILGCSGLTANYDESYQVCLDVAKSFKASY